MAFFWGRCEAAGLEVIDGLSGVIKALNKSREMGRKGKKVLFSR